MSQTAIRWSSTASLLFVLHVVLLFARGSPCMGVRSEQYCLPFAPTGPSSLLLRTTATLWGQCAVSRPRRETPPSSSQSSSSLTSPTPGVPSAGCMSARTVLWLLQTYKFVFMMARVTGKAFCVLAQLPGRDLPDACACKGRVHHDYRKLDHKHYLQHAHAKTHLTCWRQRNLLLFWRVSRPNQRLPCPLI